MRQGAVGVGLLLVRFSVTLARFCLLHLFRLHCFFDVGWFGVDRFVLVCFLGFGLCLACISTLTLLLSTERGLPAIARKLGIDYAEALVTMALLFLSLLRIETQQLCVIL